jgi:hypothetical protein
MERVHGVSASTRELRAELAAERSAAAPSSFIPLVVPARRPTPAQASPFLGKWRAVDGRLPHEVEIRASGDTIVVFDRVSFPEGPPHEAYDPVIQVTSDRVLEWGLPFFRGVPALIVQKATIVDANTMLVRDEVRGWVPRDPNMPASRETRFVRVR